MEERHSRTFTHLVIPVEVLDDRRLTATDKILLAEIEALRGPNYEGCYASNAYLGEIVGVSANTVNNIITKLRRLGYVWTLRFDGRMRWLRTTLSKEGQLLGVEQPTRKELSSPPVNGGKEKIERTIEKKKHPYPLPPELSPLQDTWEEWLRYKRERRNPMTPTTCALQIGKLLKMGAERGRAALVLAMERGWTGFGFNGHAPLDLRGKSLAQLDKMAKERSDKLSTMTRRYGSDARETGAVGKQMKQLDAELREIRAATDVILDRLADETPTTKGNNT